MQSKERVLLPLKNVAAKLMASEETRKNSAILEIDNFEKHSPGHGTQIDEIQLVHAEVNYTIKQILNVTHHSTTISNTD